jgi:hypothetical protein
MASSVVIRMCPVRKGLNKLQLNVMFSFDDRQIQWVVAVLSGNCPNIMFHRGLQARYHNNDINTKN